jgi:eukaryotic-like serine/threonine-protein kinase
MPAASSAPRVVGRYTLYDEIAAGGMASVHLGRLMGPVGFSRTVAIKRLHETFAKDPEFVSMFLDEARLAARIRHPNVVSVIDVVALQGELFLVMDYVQGESLSRLLRAARRQELVQPRMAIAILSQALNGLHAAHEARTERNEPLHLVHRDVSPQNILVGSDGVARVVDFGVAKAANRIQTTREGQLKGKLCYMAPEQLTGGVVDRRTDIYAASVVLWETLTGTRLFEQDEPGMVVAQIVSRDIPPPSLHNPDVPAALDDIVLRGLSRQPDHRFATAKDMALALERAAPPSPAAEIGEWVERLAFNSLARRAEQLANIESTSDVMAGLPIRAAELGSAQTHPAAADVLPGRQASIPQQPCPGAAAIGDSQVSSLSVASSHVAQGSGAARRAPTLWAAAAAVVIAVVGVSAWWFGRAGARDGLRAADAPSAPTALPNASAPALSTDVRTSAADAAVTLPVASTSAQPSGSQSAQPPAERKSPPKVVGTPSPARTDEFGGLRRQ